MLVHVLHGAAIALLSLSSSALISSDTIVATSFEDLGGITRHHPSTQSTPPWPSPPSASSSFSQLLVATTITMTATTTTTADDDAAVLPLPLPPPLSSSSSSCCSRQQQYDTADDIPPSSYETKEVILGRVVKVIDGDTIRIRHVPVVPPSCPHDDVPTNDDGGGGIGEDRGRSCDDDGGGRLTRCTVIVRLYGVDAPEISRKKTGGGVGGGGQPYSREAKDYVADVAYGKLARVKLLGKDRYGRVLGRVSIVGAAGDTAPPPSSEEEEEEEGDLSVGLLGGGYAKLYVGGGARYDGRRRVLEERMAKARDERRGMWAEDGGLLPVSADPAAYKRGMRARDED